MRVVVTGANGFVGAALIHALAAAGHEIVGFVRPQSDCERLADVQLEYRKGDIRQTQTLDGVFEGADWVIHSAGKLGEAGVAESVYEAVHVAGTRNVLTAVQAQAPTARVLHIGTPGVIGPLPKGTTTFPDETAAAAPSNMYERTKWSGEQMALSFAARGLDVRIVRPEFVYGPTDVHVAGLFRAIQRGIFFFIGDGENTCHPSYIDDVVDGMLLALEKGVSAETYHITGPHPVTWRHFTGLIAAELGVKPPRIRVPRALAMAGAFVGEKVLPLIGKKPPLSRTGVAFFSENRGTNWVKAGRDLGYEPRYNLKDGIARTVAWYKTHGLLD